MLLSNLKLYNFNTNLITKKTESDNLYNLTNGLSYSPLTKNLVNYKLKLIFLIEKKSSLYDSYLNFKTFKTFKNFKSFKNVIIKLNNIKKKYIKYRGYAKRKFFLSFAVDLKKKLYLLKVFNKYKLAKLINYIYRTRDSFNNLKITKFFKFILYKINLKNLVILYRKKGPIKLKNFKNKRKQSKQLLKRQRRFKLKRKKKKLRSLIYKNKVLDKVGQVLINTLKTKMKFQFVGFNNFQYGKVFFKYTGSNIFGTITTKDGSVLYSYSSGFFKGLRTRKEKTTIFVAKQLGELLVMRLYKINAKEVFFIPLINHRKARTLMKFLLNGFRLIKTFKFSWMFLKLRIMRNGVRLKKAPRK